MWNGQAMRSNGSPLVASFKFGTLQYITVDSEDSANSADSEELFCILCRKCRRRRRPCRRCQWLDTGDKFHATRKGRVDWQIWQQ